MKVFVVLGGGLFEGNSELFGVYDTLEQAKAREETAGGIVDCIDIETVELNEDVRR